MAHSAAVNCLKIGRKSSRVLVTGGEDHKVNLWAIGKPNAILVSSPHLLLLSSLALVHSMFGFRRSFLQIMYWNSLSVYQQLYLFCGQSLYGHSSGIDSVTFDASEVLVAAGAASGTIKLWDLEEAKRKFSSL